MFRRTALTGPLDLHLSESDLLEQLPAIARLTRTLPSHDWDAAWQAYLDPARQEESRK